MKPILNKCTRRLFSCACAFVLAATFVFAVTFPASGSVITVANNGIFEEFERDNPMRLRDFNYGTGRTTEHSHLTVIEDGILKMALDEDDTAGAWQGRNFAAKQPTHYGTYSARIKIPSSETQPKVGAVVGFYTYYNDEWSTGLPPDINGNGIYDNSEIDFEWLIADPEIIYLTAWTDYQDFPDGTKFGKVGRVINMATGEILSTGYGETWGSETAITGMENQPETIPAIPGYNASKEFYTYGFDWQPDSIRWWIIDPDNPDRQITLWDYRGPVERITQKPAYLSFNIWHTNNWPVVTVRGSVERPAETFWAELDWIKFEPSAAPSATPEPEPESEPEQDVDPTPAPPAEEEPDTLASATPEQEPQENPPTDTDNKPPFNPTGLIVGLIAVAAVIGFVWYKRK